MAKKKAKKVSPASGDKTQKAFVTFLDADRECGIGGFFPKGKPVEVPIDQVGNFTGIDPSICKVQIKSVKQEEKKKVESASETSETPPPTGSGEVSNG